MKKVAYFTFFGNLQDFLAATSAAQPLQYRFTGMPSVKDAIEAIGIPHVEVHAIHVNRQAVSFEYKIHGNDRIEVYPSHHAGDAANQIALNGLLPVTRRFVVDVHLGKLARMLRMLGFDVMYQTHLEDEQIARIAEQEQRIVLTRDLPLLKRKNIRFGYWLRSQQPKEQLKEVILQFDLLPHIHPFTRCISCNGIIQAVPKHAVLEHLEPKTHAYFEAFFQCNQCHKVYWKGTHYERMEKLVESIKNQL